MSKCSVVACTVGYFKGVTNINHMLRPIVLDDSNKIFTPCGTRTHSLRIRNPTSYPLRHKGWPCLKLGTQINWNYHLLVHFDNKK